MNRYMILVSVFLTGMAILIIEILATRILAPYFGNSIYTFTSVISVILLALGIGYYFGGRLSDWKLSAVLFYQIILVSGFTVLLLQFLVVAVAPWLSYQFNMIHGPLVVSLVLFFIPAFLLAFLSPYAIRLLQIIDPNHPGNDVGVVFFWSTLGSIIGSISTGFLFVPLYPIDTILMFVGYGLLILSCLGLLVNNTKHIKWVIVIILLIIAHYFISLTFDENKSDIVYEQQGLYELITVKDVVVNQRPVRLLLQDANTNSGMYLDDKSMLIDYTKYYELYKLFKPDTKQFLAIGGGAYSVPKDILDTTRDIIIDSVEIEPGLFDIALGYFSLPKSSRHTNHVMDGRRYLYETDKQYDAIFSDVYRSFAAVPMHFVTNEFFQLVYSKLTNNGVFIANIFGSSKPGQDNNILSIVKTIQNVFPQVYVFAVSDPTAEMLQNFIVVGHKQSEAVDLAQAGQIAFNFSDLNTIQNKLYRLDKEHIRQAKLYTDLYAPTEYLAADIIRQYQELVSQK